MKPIVSLLTVVGKDRPGIIAKVTGCLFQSGCNLEDVTMTVLEGELAMMLMVRFPNPGRRRSAEYQLMQVAKQWKLSVFWKSVTRKLIRGEKHPKGTRSTLITAIGKDRTGIVYHISQLLAKKKLNITDLNSRILGEKDKSLYAMMLEVDVPSRLSLKSLESALKRIERKLRVEVRVRAVERLEM